MTTADGDRILYLGSVLDARGMIRHTYAIWPGVNLVLTTPPGPAAPAYDDPAMVAEAARVRRIYAAHA